MVSRFYYFIVIALVSAACNKTVIAKDLFRQPISVVIQKNAVWEDYVSSAETADMCKDFVLSKTDVKEFFKVARVATEREYSHDLLMSRCSANGKVVMADKREGEWKIDRARRGILILSDGARYYFYCGKCQAKVFSEPCDIDCIHGK